MTGKKGPILILSLDSEYEFLPKDKISKVIDYTFQIREQNRGNDKWEAYCPFEGEKRELIKCFR